MYDFQTLPKNLSKPTSTILVVLWLEDKFGFVLFWVTYQNFGFVIILLTTISVVNSGLILTHGASF